MNAQQLSERLARVAGHVPKGSVLADIGSDHAYLPCYLVLNGIADRAVAGEVVKGPYESAVKQVKMEQLSDKIEVRLASGLEAIRKEDGITAIAIAGMGGPLITSILEQGKDRLAGVQRLILQPNIYSQSIREWAADNKWSIVEEEILKENEKIYEILVLEPSESPKLLTTAELMMGPLLMAERPRIFIEKWSKETAQWKRILSAMEASAQTAEILLKKQEIIKKIQLAEEVLHRENT